MRRAPLSAPMSRQALHRIVIRSASPYRFCYLGSHTFRAYRPSQDGSRRMSERPSDLRGRMRRPAGRVIQSVVDAKPQDHHARVRDGLRRRGETYDAGTVTKPADRLETVRQHDTASVSMIGDSCRVARGLAYASSSQGPSRDDGKTTRPESERSDP